MTLLHCAAAPCSVMAACEACKICANASPMCRLSICASFASLTCCQAAAWCCCTLQKSHTQLKASRVSVIGFQPSGELVDLCDCIGLFRLKWQTCCHCINKLHVIPFARRMCIPSSPRLGVPGTVWLVLAPSKGDSTQLIKAVAAKSLLSSGNQMAWSQAKHFHVNPQLQLSQTGNSCSPVWPGQPPWDRRTVLHPCRQPLGSPGQYCCRQQWPLWDPNPVCKDAKKCIQCGQDDHTGTDGKSLRSVTPQATQQEVKQILFAQNMFGVLMSAETA